MTIIREGIGIQNGMGLLWRNATDTLETFVGSVYRANLTLPTFFKPHLQHICTRNLRSCLKMARVTFGGNNLG